MNKQPYFRPLLQFSDAFEQLRPILKATGDIGISIFLVFHDSKVDKLDTSFSRTAADRVKGAN